MQEGSVPMDIIERLREVEENDMLERVFMITWGLWHRRNKINFENELIHPEKAADEALNLMADFQKHTISAQKPSLNRLVWQAPVPTEVLKLNVDGAVFA